MSAVEVVQLGSSGLKVSRLALGTMTFGARTDSAEARRIADRALEAGVFHWDTADMYASGASEEVVGQLLRGRRQEVVLATKAFAPMGSGANDRGLSARHLKLACEASLRRLGTDWIDLFYLHLPDRSVPLEETLRATEDLRREGKIRYLACSNYWSWEVAELVLSARAQGWAPLVAVQPRYNVFNRDIEVELLPMTERFGLGVVAYSPLSRGVLTGKYGAGATVPSDSRRAHDNVRLAQCEWRPESLALVPALEELAASRGVGLTELAVAWAMANQRVHSVLAGPRTLEQLEGYLAGAALKWDAELEAAVDALVPPGTFTGAIWPDPAYFPVRGRQLAR